MDIKYLQFRIRDDIETQLDLFNMCHDIDEFLPDGAKVLFHCRAGQSRSVTVACAYLMHKNQKTFDEAVTEIRKIRPNVIITFTTSIHV